MKLDFTKQNAIFIGVLMKALNLSNISFSDAERVSELPEKLAKSATEVIEVTDDEFKIIFQIFQRTLVTQQKIAFKKMVESVNEGFSLAEYETKPINQNKPEN